MIKITPQNAPLAVCEALDVAATIVVTVSADGSVDINSCGMDHTMVISTLALAIHTSFSQHDDLIRQEVERQTADLFNSLERLAT